MEKKCVTMPFFIELGRQTPAAGSSWLIYSDKNRIEEDTQGKSIVYPV